jgi:hypothetical protein
MSIYGILIFNQFLLMCSYLGNVLVAVLKGVKFGKKIVKGTELLGPLIETIERITSIELRKAVGDVVLNEKFRNALGHGWYWVENDRIHYYTDGTLTTEKSMTLYELFLHQRKLWHFAAAWGLVLYSRP